jgi:hypothetical protein
MNSRGKRGRWAGAAIGVTAAVTLLAALASAPPASAARDDPHATGAAAGFWISSTLDESFAAMAAQAAQTSPATVLPTLRAMLSRAEAGYRVYVPQGNAEAITSVRASAAELTQVLAAVAADRSSRPKAPASPDIPPPQKYPVRGGICPKTAKRAWCSLKLELAVEYCDPEGCTQTDRMTVTITVDPGIKTSRASFNAIYFPDDHNYAGFHFQWWVLCLSIERTCGSDNTDSFGGSDHGTFKMTSEDDMYHSRVTHAITLWGLFVRNGQYYNDDAKTGTAFCASKPDTWCAY